MHSGIPIMKVIAFTTGDRRYAASPTQKHPWRFADGIKPVCHGAARSFALSVTWTVAASLHRQAPCAHTREQATPAITRQSIGAKKSVGRRPFLGPGRAAYRR